MSTVGKTGDAFGISNGAARHLIKWVEENVRGMNASGCQNIDLYVPERVYNIFFKHMSGGARGPFVPKQQFLGHTVNAHNSMNVILVANTVNVTGSMTPVNRVESTWPPVADSITMNNHIQQLREWCKRKKSAWLKRGDVQRVCGVDKKMASRILEHGKDSGDLVSKGQWWKLWIKFDGTPKTMPPINSDFDGDTIAMMDSGVVSKQTVMKRLGINKAEKLLLQP